MVGYRAMTVTLSKDDAADFPDWCKRTGINIMSTYDYVNLDFTQFILTMLAEDQVAMLKLAWARYDIQSSPRTI